jgi:hypothetical protein
MGQNFIRKISNSMKIELTESEYTFLSNLLNDYAELVKNNICDLEADIRIFENSESMSKIAAQLEKIEMEKHRDKLVGVIKKIDQQKNSKIK